MNSTKHTSADPVRLRDERVLVRLVPRYLLFRDATLVLSRESSFAMARNCSSSFFFFFFLNTQRKLLLLSRGRSVPAVAIVPTEKFFVYTLNGVNIDLIVT